MENEHERERLSAFMDGELPEGEAADLLAACRSRNGLAGEWSLYHCIGDVLRSDDMGCHSEQLSASIARCLESEAHLLAIPVKREDANSKHRFRRPASAVAAFAAVAVVAGLVVPRWTSEQAQVAQAPPVRLPAPSRPSPVEAPAPQAASAGVPREYIAAHRQYSGNLAMQGVVSRVRSVTYDSGQ